ncbi:MAG: ribonuclease Z [Candidatus Sericytochromatia bacterium]|nr:MAG: ribonuclease Z [Candidatus Sericytochromatia bacterium]
MKVELENIIIEGFSRSTIETYFYIKDLHLSFDIGKCPFHLVSVPNIFLSHMHGDHCIGLYYYISHRNLAKMPLGKIYIPEGALEDLNNLIKSFSKLEHSNRTYELTPLKEDIEFEYNRVYNVRTFSTDHRIPSLGYTFFYKKSKLKEEFLGLSQKEIVKLKNEGIEITNKIKEPFITYLGDSTFKPLDNKDYDFIKKSKILIMECTFILPEHYEEATLRKHIHIQDIINRKDQFQNKYIILSHFSMRYESSFIHSYLNKILPKELKEKVIIFV